MTAPGGINPLLLAATAAAPPSGYNIERSLRFNSSDSAFLSRTPASAGSRKTWTWAGWVKRSTLGTVQSLFHANTGDVQRFMFNTDDKLYWVWGNGSIWRVTDAVYRDTSAWYHIMLVSDTDNATAGNRLRFYVNSVEQSTSGTTVTSGLTWDINTAVAHRIGSFVNFYGGGADIAFFSGYLADVHFIDGQALDPTSFTEVDATTGQLIPKAYSGTYGTNGFHLPFSDNSTAAALGTDTSGNSNTWTVNNISVAAGSGNDSLVDTPTSYGTDTGAGGEVRGNYCVVNGTLPYTNVTLSNGNLDVTGTATYRTVAGTVGVSSGKWYWEVIAGSANASLDFHVGIGNSTFNSYIGTWAGSTANGWIYSGYQGYKYNNNSGSAYGAAFTSGDIIGVALDADNGTITFYKNGVSQGQAYSGLTSGPYFPVVTVGNSNTGVFNFGQRPFAYTAPSGYKALCTTNLPDPVVAKPSEVMDVVTYTGNGTSQTISGLNFSPDFVWLKSRGTAYNHQLFDTIRGAGKQLYSNSTSAETTESFSWLNAFNSDGFGVTGAAGVNDTSDPMVAWTWDAGSSTVTNTQGSITSSVRANASAGFSVVSWAAPIASGTVGHGLGSAPSLIIFKDRGIVSGFFVYHKDIGAGKYLQLNTTAATATSSVVFSTAPTSTVFNPGTDFTSGNSYTNLIAYCFAPVDGYSSFGSYTGNGSADGPFVYTGFRPRWVMIKYTSGPISDISNARWLIVDSARNTYNVVTQRLEANNSGSEITDTSILDFTSNGFKIRWHPSDVVNSSGATYIYAAFAESPFQYARAR